MLEVPFPEIDLFATTTNSLCDSFYSRFGQVGCSGIDTLSLNLTGIKGYAFPPVAIITRFLRHLLQFRCSVIVILPVWTGSSFWQIICPDGVHSAPFVRGHLRLTSHLPSPDVVIGPIGRPSFLSEPHSRHRYEWVALHLDTTSFSCESSTRTHPPFCVLSHFNVPCSLCYSY